MDNRTSYGPQNADWKAAILKLFATFQGPFDNRILLIFLLLSEYRKLVLRFGPGLTSFLPDFTSQKPSSVSVIICVQSSFFPLVHYSIPLVIGFLMVIFPSIRKLVPFLAKISILGIKWKFRKKNGRIFGICSVFGKLWGKISAVCCRPFNIRILLIFLRSLMYRNLILQLRETYRFIFSRATATLTLKTTLEA